MNVGRYRIADHCRHALHHLFFPDHKFHLQPHARQASPDLLAMMPRVAADPAAVAPSVGWDSWFEEQARLRCDPAGAVARVAAVDRDQLLLLNETGAFRAKYSGEYKYEAASSLERPCVGDWVCVEKSPADRFGLVQGVLSRKTSLRRRAAGESVEYQMIAANVDGVLIVQSCHYIPMSQAVPF